MLAKHAKIMIVDDMKLIRTAIKKYLASLGYESIVEAGDGQEALATYAAAKPDFIFLDIVMPNLSGSEVLREIRKNDKDTPIVMLTSVAEEQMIKDCKSLGILGYAIKPINKEIGPQLLSDLLALA